jgi:hypothetical protein
MVLLVEVCELLIGGGITVYGLLAIFNSDIVTSACLIDGSIDFQTWQHIAAVDSLAAYEPVLIGHSPSALVRLQ